ncbi:hypothetical protein ACFQ07_16045, partial [Actinomadura adrarensis]
MSRYTCRVSMGTADPPSGTVPVDSHNWSERTAAFTLGSDASTVMVVSLPKGTKRTRPSARRTTELPGMYEAPSPSLSLSGTPLYGQPPPPTSPGLAQR